ncbi:MAG TPA: hypothetical protein VK668_10205 [Mucilaginibacter sp.]|nr:hypothetical protein [Mucilaginibacter sp.]
MPKLSDNKLVPIAILGLLTGTLDAIAAIIISYPVAPAAIFKYIASGLFGGVAFTGSNMILWGILFHYIIATFFSAAFFSLHPQFRMLIKNKYFWGIIYGLLIWVVMNIAVLPLTNVPKQPEQLHTNWMGIFKGMAVLIICLGLPISFVADRFYIKKARRRSRRHRAGTSHRQH